MSMPTIIKRRSLLLFALLVPALLSAAACTNLKSYGRFVPDSDVTAAINRAEINPDFNYYISGSDAYPRSILGLNKAYVIVDADLWKKVELKPEELNEITGAMLHRGVNCLHIPTGFSVFDNKGNKIGIWYSIIVPEISIKMVDERSVVIYPPSDRNYACYDEVY